MLKRAEEMQRDLWTSLLLVWITCVPYSSMAPLNNQSQSLQTASAMIPRNRPSEGQRILSRAKRGWVWNQMFVLEEFSGPDPILVGRLHTDLDVGAKNIKYVLAGEGAGTIFAINEKTGDIHAMKRLDREEKAEYTLTAQVIDRDSDQPLEPPSEFIIKVQDINDNPPQFIEGPYKGSVPEMSQVGTSVTRVTATDADDPVYGNSAKLVYSILEGQPYFSIDQSTAIIRVALAGMDREMREEYLVVIQAKDMGGHMGGLSGTTTVTVTLTDINDNPPKFSKGSYEFTIPENLGIGKPGGRVKANDRDIGENAKSTYSIIGGDERDVFEIVTDAQTQEGILRLKKPLDFESKKSYNLTVVATNIRADSITGGPYMDQATVKIIVEDADEPPVFTKSTYLFDVHENAAINTVIGAVAARDQDAPHSQVRYFIDRHTDLERQFNINVDDGKITLAKPLDRETDMWHNITVTATEVRNHSQISRAIVAIKVLDINDNAPEFATEYEAFLCENGKPGQVIQTISAVDKDNPSQGHTFHYRLEMLNNPNFTIKNNLDLTVCAALRSWYHCFVIENQIKNNLSKTDI
ncbi:cadherin-8 isoform X2 [Onychostoma macrolepis]|uniref:cadherin-8 isoform X2 n=1 Tax=Onychostoma macrolepis TaxID=369639 RepID=UPI00272971E7|nr:cadherin-8 isoform X2 [Onychostoma macrolepis]